MRTLTDKKNNAIDLVCDLIAKRQKKAKSATCLVYTSPSPRDLSTSRIPSAS